jgi:hypothetical protein
VNVATDVDDAVATHAVPPVQSLSLQQVAGGVRPSAAAETQ